MALHRALDGDDDAPIPFEHWLGHICEEFPVHDPLTAYEAWLRAPAGLFEQVLEYRAYAAAKSMYDAANTDEARERLPKTSLLDLVEEIEYARAGEVLAARRAAAQRARGGK